MNNFAFSSFIVPVAGCLSGIVAIVAGIWLEGTSARSSPRNALHDFAWVPLAEIDRNAGCG